MVTNFTAALAFALRPENDGQGYHNTPGDHGGPTAWGVTFSTWLGWQRAHQQPATLGVFQALTEADVAPIYRAWFWAPCSCDALPGGVDAMVFDFANGSGPGTSAKLLQRVLEVDDDGQIGPQTLAAVAALPVLSPDLAHPGLLALLYSAQCSFLRSLGQPLFEHGWLRRRADNLAFAKTLASA